MILISIDDQFPQCVKQGGLPTLYWIQAGHLQPASSSLDAGGSKKRKKWTQNPLLETLNQGCRKLSIRGNHWPATESPSLWPLYRPCWVGSWKARTLPETSQHNKPTKDTHTCCWTSEGCISATKTPGCSAMKQRDQWVMFKDHLVVSISCFRHSQYRREGWCNASSTWTGTEVCSQSCPQCFQRSDQLLQRKGFQIKPHRLRHPLFWHWSAKVLLWYLPFSADDGPLLNMVGYLRQISHV